MRGRAILNPHEKMQVIAETASTMPQPHGEDRQRFAEPWQAQAFAMTVALHQSGLFTWSEWTEALSTELQRPEARQDGGYYLHWLAALERLLAAKHLADVAEIDSVAAAWQRAARATLHGEPILLENDPEADCAEC